MMSDPAGRLLGLAEGPARRGLARAGAEVTAPEPAEALITVGRNRHREVVLLSGPSRQGNRARA